MTDATGSMTIGQLAERTGVPATTLRYYDRIDLLLPAARSGGRRIYDEHSCQKLEIIGICRRAGFSLDEIALLYADRSPERARSKELARSKLVAIQAQMDELQEARAIVEWGLRCECPVLDECTCGVHPPATVTNR